MVDDLDLLDRQGDKALVATGEGLLGRSAGYYGLGLFGSLLRGAWVRREEVIGTTTDGGSAEGVDGRVGALLGSLGGIATGESSLRTYKSCQFASFVLTLESWCESCCAAAETSQAIALKRPPTIKKACGRDIHV